MPIEPAEIPQIRLQARPEELRLIDEATYNYIQLLQIAVEPSEERDVVVGWVYTFRQRYQELLTGVRCTRYVSSRKALTREKQPHLLSWSVTSFELIACGCALIAYLRLLQMAQVPEKRRQKAIEHLTTFQKRYLDTLPQVRPDQSW